MNCFVVVLALAFSFVGQSAAPHIKAAQAAYQEGQQAEAAKQLEHAADCFRKAIEIEPTFIEARESLVATYLDSGQRLNGAAAITQLLEILPDALKYRILLGQILLEQKQSKKALAQFSLVLKQDPNNADGLLGFATAANQVGIKERASAALKRGRDLYPQDQRFKSSREDAHK
jgi:tetratricopeptide (TPR) repeat protein